MADLPSRTATYGCDCLNDCGDDPRVCAGTIRRCDWGAHWKEVHDRRQCVVDAAPALLAALQRTWEVLESAGLLQLSRGVELGAIAWHVKADGARLASLKAIAAATGEEAASAVRPAHARTVESLQRELLAIARGGKFAETWREMNGHSHVPNLRDAMEKLARIQYLRVQIIAINPNAALYYGWGVPGDRNPAKEAQLAAYHDEKMRLFGPNGDN